MLAEVHHAGALVLLLNKHTAIDYPVPLHLCSARPSVDRAAPKIIPVNEIMRGVAVRIGVYLAIIDQSELG